MRGVARSFWAVVAVVVALEVLIGVRAFRSVDNDLTCWVSGLKHQGYSIANCGAAVAIVGHQDWVPATLILILFLATVCTGVSTLVSQCVRTRLALRRSPGRSWALGSRAGFDVLIC